MISLILSIIGPLMPLVVKGITRHLEKINASRETKKAWLGFIGAMEKDANSSADLADSYEEQLDRLSRES